MGEQGKSRGRPRLGPEVHERATRLRRRREALGLAPSDLARALGIQPEHYRYLERCWSDDAALKHGVTIATLLRCDLGWLFDGTGAVPDPPSVEAIAEVRSALTPEVPLHIRQLLGARARKRRVELGYSSVAEFAKTAGLNHLFVRKNEAAFQAGCVSQEKVDLWETALEVPSGWLQDEAIQAPKASRMQTGEGEPETLSELIWLAARQLVSAHARRVDGVWHLPPSAERNVKFFAARYGVHGEEAATLQAVGDNFGLTRERVRQVTDKLLQRVDALNLPAGIVDRLEAAVADLLPATVETLDAQLRPMLGQDLSVVGADRFTRDILGRTLLTVQPGTYSQVAKVAPYALAKDSGDEDLLRMARAAALKMISACGAGNLYWVAGMIAGKGGKSLTAEAIGRALAAVDGYEVLRDPVEGWFWFGPDPRSKVETVTRKVLSVATRRVDVEDIQEAIARSRRERDKERGLQVVVELPLMILAAMLSKMPGIRTIQANDYVLDQKPALADVLSQTELSIYEVLAARGGVSDRAYIFNEVVRRQNVTQVSFQVVLDQSPIIRRLDYGIYGLRGWPLERGATSKAISKAIFNRGGDRSLRVADGKLTFRVVITEAMFRNRSCGVSASVIDACKGSDTFSKGDRQIVFKRNADKGGRVVGLVSILKADGHSPGDRVTIELNLVDKTFAIRSVGGKAK